MHIHLPDRDATRDLGRRLAAALSRSSTPCPVFFYGDLGTGKTTLISALVKALPGGENAETSSPSFTVCNLYPTIPPVAHYDLYRQENETVDESLLDFLDEGRHVVLVEWAQRLPARLLPPDRLECTLTGAEPGRFARIASFGSAADRVAALLRKQKTP